LEENERENRQVEGVVGNQVDIMPRRLKELDSSLLILDAQPRLRKTHATPTMVPKLPADPDARRTLTKNLEDMGCARLLNFPWTLVNQAMVDKLSQARAVPEEVRQCPQRGALHYVKEQTVAEIYEMSMEGDKRPHDNQD
jgi:hypothetical protein